MKGHCLCGSVVVTAPDTHEVEVCHCGMCRRWSGGPALVVHCGSQPDISGKEHLKIYASSDWAERAFCGECGTHIYYHLVPANQYICPAGLFQDEAQFELATQIFVDHKPSYYAFANQTKTMTEAEVLALYSQT